MLHLLDSFSVCARFNSPAPCSPVYFPHYLNHSYSTPNTTRILIPRVIIFHTAEHLTELKHFSRCMVIV